MYRRTHALCKKLFTSRELVLRLLYVFRVCLFVVRPHLSRAHYYVMRYYATAVYYRINRFVGQDTASECRFVLPRWRKSGRQPYLQLLKGSARRNC